MNASDLLKMSAFARRSGVPAATIKHYVKEGLLPPPVRAARNVAYYDARHVPRVLAIKRLQSSLFLPLDVIRSVLDGLDRGMPPEDATFAAAIARALGDLAPNEVRTKQQLLDGGMPEADLAFFKSLGVVTPTHEDGQERYGGDDLELLRVLGRARQAGISREMLPPEVLRAYVDALRRLVKAELSMFRAGVLPVAGDDVERLTEVATTLSERLVVLLRRKLLLPTLSQLTRADEDDGGGR